MKGNIFEVANTFKIEVFAWNLLDCMFLLKKIISVTHRSSDIFFSDYT